MNETARNIAAAIITAAQEQEIMDGSLSIPETVPETERQLFAGMLTALHAHQQRKGNADITYDEIASMFTFVFAKAAEIVTDYVNRQPSRLDTAGLFDGKVPLYTDERLVGCLKKSEWPTVAAEAFLNRPPDGADPLLALFEALKWTFRVSVHFSIRKIEELGIQFP